MSLDQVDDIEHAEELLAVLDGRIRDALTHDEIGRAPLRGQDRRFLVDALGETAAYCRPTCGMNGEAHEAELGVTPGYADSCGCPCHIRRHSGRLLGRAHP